MMVIPERSLDWVERWTNHGLRLGRHDGSGNPAFEFEAGDGVAADLIAELQADAILKHGVVVIILAMVERAAAEGDLE